MNRDNTLSPFADNASGKAQRTCPFARAASSCGPLLAVLAILVTPAPAGETAPTGEQAPADAPDGPPAEIALTDRGTLRMHVAGVPLSDVLHVLSLTTQRNIVASPNVQGTVTANLYDATFDEALDAVLIPNGAGYRTAGNFIFVYTLKELEELRAREWSPVTRVYRLNYLTAADTREYLQPLLAKDESISVPPPPSIGLESNAEDGGGQSNAAQDFVIVTARELTHQQVAAILKQVDIRPRQVLIEATILRAELSEDNALGVDFTLVGGVDLQLLGSTSLGVQNLTLGPLPPERFEEFNISGVTDLTGNVPAGGLKVGIVQDQVAVFIRALEEVTDTTVLANPKVLALNRQKAQVIVGRRDGFFTTTVTETQAIQNVEFLESGTRLIFRPFIGDDDFVRVELNPKDSVGFITAQGLPTEQTTEVTTNVLVRDGETILIGGLFREVTTDARAQVPALGNIPILGALFQSRRDTTSREEVIILLTVHVVKDRQAYADASSEMFDDVERSRVGTRRGLMVHGRERLAQAHYQRALDAAAADRPRLALWHVNLALHNQPNFVAAIRLKERILSERAWEQESTDARMFLHSLIARERGYRLPAFGRPSMPTEPNGGPEPNRDRKGAENSDEATLDAARQGQAPPRSDEGNANGGRALPDFGKAPGDDSSTTAGENY